MTPFDQPPPAFSREETLEVLRLLYGIGGDLRPLVSERDQNFHVTTPDGAQFVLKIANVGESPAQLRFENKVLTFLAETDPGLGTPQVVHSVDGDDLPVFELGGTEHCIRLLTFVQGRLLSQAQVSDTLLSDLGRYLGRLNKALAGFMDPAAFRPDFLWNLERGDACRDLCRFIARAEDRALMEAVFARHAEKVAPILPALRGALIHQDANDNNVLVDPEGAARITGIIDFGDMVWGRQVNELAVALAYVLMKTADPLAAACQVVASYHQVHPLLPEEIQVLMDLVALRLACSVAISSWRSKDHPENEYLLISQAPALDLLKKLAAGNRHEMHFALRQACGFDPIVEAPVIAAWLTANRGRFASPLPLDLRRATKVFMPLHGGAPGAHLATDPEAHGKFVTELLARSGSDFAVGGYLEDRDVYKGDQFASPDAAERRTVHLGIDFFAPTGTPVHAAIAGKVCKTAVNDADYDYGGVIVLEHRAGDDGPAFWTLYGHLSHASADLVREGQEVAAGEQIGWMGPPRENGHWAPHLHFQVMTSLLGITASDFPGVTRKSRVPLWQQICLDPNLVLNLPPEALAPVSLKPSDLQAQRRDLVGPSLSLSYRDPLTILRGEGPWLIDERGRAYLDCVNNICHVGHSHPRVVAAMAEQAAVLNTNTRYLHPNILTYARRLAETMPGDLEVCYFVCSGSEANELAMRLARTFTGRGGAVVLEDAYHGNTSGLVDISPYKCEGPGGRGLPDWVAKAERPDPFRGRHRGMTPACGQAYSVSVSQALNDLEARGCPAAFYIAESILGVGGQLVLPPDYLSHAYDAVHRAGGLCIADEVQVGFGRVGSHMWAFETQGVVPDIVTLGKPMGNGHPLACVVTRPEIAEAFANGMEFFNSFGGNPVSCAVGNAVLDVIEDEGLQENARIVGAYLKDRLTTLAESHGLIGDVRGLGLFLGVELVKDRESLEPATAEAKDLVNRAKAAGVLLSTDGPDENVIKIKPPLCFGREHADILADTLDQLLRA